MDLPLVIGGIPIIPINFSEPPLTVAMRALSLLGTIPLVTLAALVLALVLFWRRRTISLILLALTVGGGELITLLLKWLFMQTRPSWPDPLVVLTSASFPSGHAMRSVLFFGLLSYLLVPRIGSRRGRFVILLAGGGLVLLIGVSRVYLGTHSLSEVLAGYAVGVGWFLCLLIGIIAIQRNRRNSIDRQVLEDVSVGRQTLSRKSRLSKLIVLAAKQVPRSKSENIRHAIFKR